ncbi:MAG: F0F1 ATP synthase subunit B [Chloroflexota bacterium]|nr:F0F1 ATP synthase subunit B [Chloroflexota bacterium]
MLDSLGINGWNLLVQLIAFIIFLWLLWRFALGPITRVIDERQDRIRESVEAAERMKAELAATAARNEEVLVEARQQAQQIVAQARDAGEATLNRAREQANAQAEEYLTRAEATLRQETQQARQQLRQEVADLAVMAAGRIVRKELDPATQTRLIEETLAEAAPTTNGRSRES